MVGYLEITREPEIERIILEGWIHPDHRRKGLAKRLLAKVISRAHELSIPRLQVNIMDSNGLAQKVLSRLGFKCVRKYNELRLATSVLNLPQSPDSQIAPRSLQNGEEVILTELQNRCFVGSWGYHPNTVDAIIYRMNSSGCSPHDVILICQEDRPISYCWTEITPPSTSSDMKVGRIYMIGVDPDYRGRGLGRKVLVTSLTHLKNKGAEIIELTVDSANHVACSLYRTIGFTKRATSLWYERQA
jgi:mycothiol synthase